MALPNYLCALDTLEVDVDTLDTLDTLDSILDSTLDTLSPNLDSSGCKQQIQNKILKEMITSWMSLEYDT